jgi:hypothetical protein
MDAALRRQLAVAGPLLLLVLLASGLAAVFWSGKDSGRGHILHVSSAGAPEGHELLLAQVVFR